MKGMLRNYERLCKRQGVSRLGKERRRTTDDRRRSSFSNIDCGLINSFHLNSYPLCQGAWSVVRRPWSALTFATSFQNHPASMPDILFGNSERRSYPHAIWCEEEPVCEQSFCKATINYFFIYIQFNDCIFFLF